MLFWAATKPAQDKTPNATGKYLLKHLTLPLCVTGTEDFPWEAKYVFGGWDEKEAYDAEEIWKHSRSLNHVPIIDLNRRGAAAGGRKK